MSKLSKIRARWSGKIEELLPRVACGRCITELINAKTKDIPYLLDLVKRMGEVLDRHGRHMITCDYTRRPCDCGWLEARELLKEIEK